MENDKIISLKNLLQHLCICRIHMNEKIEFIFIIFSKKFPNRCKEQTKNKVPSQSFPII